MHAIISGSVSIQRRNIGSWAKWAAAVL